MALTREYKERIYLNRQENTVWLYCDVNHDGIDELIYQEKEVFQENMHPILGIFAITDNGCERILWDTGDYTKFLEDNVGECEEIYLWVFNIIYIGIFHLQLFLLGRK